MPVSRQRARCVVQKVYGKKVEEVLGFFPNPLCLGVGAVPYRGGLVVFNIRGTYILGGSMYKTLTFIIHDVVPCVAITSFL